MTTILNLDLKNIGSGKVFLGFLGIFLLFFLPFPLQHSLVGDVDTFYNISMYRQMKGFLDGLMGMDPTGTLCYPAEGSFAMKFWSYYGANFGIGIIHVVLLYLGMSDLWAHWMFFAILFTLNAWTLYLLMHQLFQRKPLAMLLALFFMLGHFTLANLDNINSLVFFPSFYALYALCRSLPPEGPLDRRRFLVSVFIGALLIWLSPYNFVIHFALWFILLVQREGPRFPRVNLKLLLAGAIIYVLVLSPYFYVYFFSDIAERNLPEHITRNFIHIQSLNPDDLLRVLKNHLYFEHEILLGNPLLSKLRAAFLGFTLYLLAFLGLFRRQNRWLGLAFVLIGLIVSIGPFYSWQNMRLGINPFLFYFYEWFDLYDTISVPIRFFFITLFGLVILAGNGIILIAERWKKPILVWFLVPLVFLENVPIGMETYEHKAILQPAQAEIVAIAQAEGNGVLYLPASLEEITFNYRREYLYNYWQHFHDKDVVNGFPPFLPDARLAADRAMRPFERTRFREYLQRDGIDIVVYHGELSNTPEDVALGDSLAAQPWLEPRYSGSQVKVYSVLPVD